VKAERLENKNASMIELPKDLRMSRMISVTLQAKMWVCSFSITGTVGSNPAEVMDFHVLLL
jgi:hypothetical protein